MYYAICFEKVVMPHFDCCNGADRTSYMSYKELNVLFAIITMLD